MSLRKPPEADVADKEAFVRAASEPAPVANPSPLAPVDSPKPKGVIKRSDGSEARRLVTYLAPDVMHRLRMHCAAQEKSLTDAVNEAVLSYLEANSH